jgi:Zn-dependent protease with chaperone function
MLSAAPTVVALETNSAWILILVVSLVTFPLVLLLRRLINRPGGFASGLLLVLPLALPIAVALAFHDEVLPEIAVLKPAAHSLLNGAGRGLFDVLLFSDSRGAIVVPYALWGEPGRWLLLFAVSVSSFMLLRRLVGMAAVGRLMRRCRPLEESPYAPVGATLRELVRASRIPRIPRVLVLPPGFSGAFVSGGRGGRILLSEDLLESLNPDELRGLLAHEIAHLEARDVAVVFAGGLLRDLVAWNPLAHVSFRRLAHDREFEADRRAAALTNNPLAVASSLLRVYELGRRGFGTRAALPFAGSRGRGRVTRRVSRLIALADSGAIVRSPNYLPFVAAAVIAAVMALQVGARIGGQAESAFAIVVGAPRIGEIDVWGARPDSKRAAPVRGRAKAAPSKAEMLRHLELSDASWDAGVGVRTRDIPTWQRALVRLAKQNEIPVSVVRAELQEGWRAVPIFSGPGAGAVALYRMERGLPPEIFRVR